MSPDLNTYYPLAAPKGEPRHRVGRSVRVAVHGRFLDWSMLPLHVDGPVMFGYATVAGPSGTNPPVSVTVNGQVTNLPQPSTVDWFVINAPAATSIYKAPPTRTSTLLLLVEHGHGRCGGVLIFSTQERRIEEK